MLRRQLEALLSASSSDCMATQTLASASLLLTSPPPPVAGGNASPSAAPQVTAIGASSVTLLWNLVYQIHRVGLPTHLLDALPAWLMDLQADPTATSSSSTSTSGRRSFVYAGGGTVVVARALSVSPTQLSRTFFTFLMQAGARGLVTMTSALFYLPQEVALSADLPVRLVARWDSFPRRNRGPAITDTSGQSPQLYRHWSPSINLPDQPHRRRPGSGYRRADVCL